MKQKMKRRIKQRDEEDMNGLIDLGFSGNPFTWRGHGVQERLDRAIVSAEWHIDYHKASLHHLPIISSDHAPILLNTCDDKTKTRNTFKFESCWTRDETSRCVIHKAWNVRVFGCNQSKWCRRLKNTQYALKLWNRHCFGHCQSQIASITCRIKSLQGLPVSRNSQEEEKGLLLHLDELRTREEWIWNQKARIDWSVNGDKATKFFFLTTAIRRKKNAMEKLLINDCWVSDRKEIGLAFVDYYENLFASSNPSLNDDWTLNSCEDRLDELIKPSISQDQNDFICKPPTDAEIKDIAFSIGKLKAPGPDGFSAIFFQFYWNTVGKDLIFMVKEFFYSGFMHKEINHYYVALILKRKIASKVEHFRPISLCNFSYKVISKLLANRLKTTLNKIISPLQSAFIPGRSISDNIIMTQEILHKFKRTKGERALMAIKYDMAKAYDKVEWKFLNRILILFGFDSHFVKLVMNCVTTTTMAFLINGKPFGYIKPRRGIRQGDPISSYLFLLCGEVLSRLFLKKETSKLLKGVSIGYQVPPITHLMFADDLICFSEANVENYDVIKLTLDKYERWSGQTVNVQKSGVIFSRNATVIKKDFLKSVMNMSDIPSDSLYLGQPITMGRSKSTALIYLVDRALTRVAGWKSKVLSYAGREVLIKSVLSSIPSYTMLHFKIPKNICVKIDGVVRKFWWGHDQESTRSLCPIAWDKICAPKMEGGLGFRRMASMNDALLGKLAWEILTKADKIRVKQCLARYCKKTIFVELDMRNNSASTIWQNILRARNFIKAGCCIIIGDGTNTKISDPWVPGIPGFKPELIAPSLNQVSDLKVANFILPNIKQWDISFLKSIIVENSITEILKMRIPSFPIVDKWRWIKNSNGEYTVKSGYLTNRSNSVLIDGDSKLACKGIWKMKVHNRHKIYMWRILRGALLTKTNLGKRFPLSDIQCPLCNSLPETEIHVFWECSVARALWLQKWGIRVDTIKFTHKWGLINLVMYGGKAATISDWNLEMQLWTIAFMENVWQSRNKILFVPDFKMEINQLALKINQRANDLAISNMKKEVGARSKSQTEWKAPPRGWVKVNCDAALKNGISVAAGVVRNEVCIILETFVQEACSENPLVIEALALFEAVSLAKERKWNKVVFESDSWIAINALSEGNRNPIWEINGIVSDILAISGDFANWIFKKISRLDNTLAHNIAQDYIKKRMKLSALASAS